MYCVNYGRKRDKRIVLSSNMISWECITVILAFCKHAFVYTSSHAESLRKNGAMAAEYDQKERRLQVCQDIIEHLQTEPDLLRRIITGDETFNFEYDPETKRQRCQWKSPTSPRPKKARQSKSKVKVMLITFFDVRGIVPSEFLPQGQTINQQVYNEILRLLLRSLREK